MTDRTLLAQALDALEAALSDDQPYIAKCKASADALRARLAQPDAEPVAWYLPSPDGDDSIFRDHRTVIACAGNKWEGFLPLYAAPPAAPAPVVPLTDERIAAISEGFHVGNRDTGKGYAFAWLDFARAVIAADRGITSQGETK